ncbi:7711_t:CDS:10 [Funneliformis caledonium]|uniref:7711_t:CDS:1 n=1 Tax=Funneliformis caledonium TaxID=1117310 RepID=A0A9N9C692_9GLOM|nr:7711_t:CDS:10 [Funneliformis caledonium]
MSQDSLYARYKHGNSVSTPPTSAWSLSGIGSVPAPYPLSFKTEVADKVREEEKYNKTGLVGRKKMAPTEDILTSYRETSSNVIRSPSSSTKQMSILAQTTPVKKAKTQPLKLDSTPPIDSKPTPRPSKLPGQTSFYGYEPYSAEVPSFRSGHLIGSGFDGLKRSAQVTISQFDDNVYIKEDPSIATTFDPEKDKSLYDTAVGLYRQFTNTDILDSILLLYTRSNKGYYFRAIKNIVNAKSIVQSSLHTRKPLFWHGYVWFFFFLYVIWLSIYLNAYEEYFKSEEWTFLTLTSLITMNALIFLSCQWSTRAKAFFTCKKQSDIKFAQVIKIIPALHKGKGELCDLHHRDGEISFFYQKKKYVWDFDKKMFNKLRYPADQNPVVSIFQNAKGLETVNEIKSVQETYGFNRFDIPVPTFRELFKEHAVAPFFVFQLFCVGLWIMDEYWYYSLFTLFMLVVFESTRLKTLAEFRSMSFKPFQIHVRRKGRWVTVNSDELLPGDLVSIVRSKEDNGVPCDMVLVNGTCIVDEAMLTGESTPSLKESIHLRDGNDVIDTSGIVNKYSQLFGGTKVLQITPPSKEETTLSPPDNGCIAYVIRTGFGTVQGKLVRTMVYSTGHVSANNLESFFFIIFLLIFAISAAGYVWVKGVENDRKRSKLLLDCILIITSVVPPELPMELSLAVNTSLVALSKFAIYCTEPFRIPYAGKVDVCAFDKTGTLTRANLVVEGVAGIQYVDHSCKKPFIMFS